MIRKLILTTALVIFGFASNARAQNISTTTCPGAGCIDINVGGQGSIGIQVTGTWVGTITFKASVDQTNFVSLNLIPSNSGTATSTTTSNGAWSGPIAGFNIVRVVFTAYTSGTAVVTRRITTEARSSGSGGSSGDLTATYVINTADAALINAQILAALSTGIVNVTTTTGALTSFAPTDDNLLLGSGTVWQLKALTDCQGTGKAVTFTASSNTFGCNTISGTPPGSDTQVIFNDASAFGADAGLTFSKANGTLTVDGNGNTQGIWLKNTTDAAGYTYKTYLRDLGLNHDVQWVFNTSGISFGVGGRSIDIFGQPLNFSPNASTAADVGIYRKSTGLLQITDGVMPALGTPADMDVLYRHSFAGGTGIAVSNTSANSCGTTAATIVGKDQSFKVTVGATSGTSCTVTFGAAFPSAPVCFSKDGTVNLSTTESTTTVIIAGVFSAGDVIKGICSPF